MRRPKTVREKTNAKITAIATMQIAGTASL